MPKAIPERKKRKPPPSSNGVTPEIVKSRLDGLLAMLKPAKDEWDFSEECGEPIEAGSMADVRKLIGQIEWLIDGWIPLGMCSMLVSPPGVGKSSFAIYALVRPIVTGGLKWFTGQPGPNKPGNVLWCDTENTAAINLDRMEKWDIPMDGVKVPFAKDPLRSINLEDPDDVSRIEKLIVACNIRLVIVDSLRGAHGGDENSSRVGKVVGTLAEIAQRTGAAIVILHHTKKLSADEDISDNSARGSNAQVALCRTQLGITRPDQGSDWKKLEMLKENLGKKPPAVGFRITDKGLDFGSAPERPRKMTQKLLAEDWIRSQMVPGEWVKAKPILDAAAENGFSRNAIHRANENLGIVKPRGVKREGGVSWWRLPPSDGE